ncbi:hypothetical protein, partial [Emticicia sp. W12TSBA100-4]|uniref:hypothetical protein n=1 Tax=Emticicia sp. W12TSBA100-4 TaxID=3160965 RepID=UPI0033063EE6
VDVVVGFVNQVKGGGGVKGYVFGSLDVSGIQVGLNSNDTVNNTLGRRLGDCTSANRTLTVTFEDGTIKNIVFASNYTNTSNATIIAEINSALGSSGICDEYNPALEYYPEVLDKQITIQNNTTQGIARFSAVAYNSSKRYGRQMTTTDSAADFVGIALQQIAPGECGRVLVEGIIENIQLQSLTGTINYNSDISISSAVGGGFVVDSSKQIGKGVATNWFEFRGNK